MPAEACWTSVLDSGALAGEIVDMIDDLNRVISLAHEYGPEIDLAPASGLSEVGGAPSLIARVDRHHDEPSPASFQRPFEAP